MRKKQMHWLVVFVSYLICIPHSSLGVLTTEKEILGQDDKDVVIITNPKKPFFKRDKKLRIEFKEDLSIGEIEGDDNYLFGNRVFLNVDESGHIYVTDWDRKRIQKFDPEGRYVLTIGKLGQGPGEFQNVGKPKFYKNELYVSDPVLKRISFFDKKGQYLRQIKIPVLIWDFYIVRPGVYLGLRSDWHNEGDKSTDVSVLGVFDENFQLIAEMQKLTNETKFRAGRDVNTRAQFIADIWEKHACRASRTFFMGDENLYFGYPLTYEIKIFSDMGVLKKVIGREYDPIDVNQKHKRDFFQFLEDEAFRFNPADEKTKKEVFRRIDWPKKLPAYKQFALMENGWLFVIIDYAEGEYMLVDLFNQEGQYIAQFEASIPADGLLFKNNKAYAVSYEDGFKYVKRYSYSIQEY